MIAVLLALIVLSAYFSATETAFSSLSRIRIKNMASEGNRKAKLVNSLLDNYDELLSTVLIGNNLVNIAATSIATVLFIQLWGNIGSTISTVVMTIVVLVFGEVTPKSLAKEAPESFAMFSAGIIKFLMVFFKPFNFFFRKLKSFLKRLFNVNSDKRLTGNELLTIVAEAQQGGGIDSDESELLRNAIEFDDIAAEDILTPRVDIIAIRKDTPKDKIASIFSETGFSRLPVYDDSIDYITGVLHEKNFYRYVWDNSRSIESIIKPVIFIPASIKISNLLKRLQDEKLHMAIVVDEFGGTQGLVTLEDVIEELIGDIWDEHDEIKEESFKQDDSGKYIVYCSIDLDDLLDFFNLHLETDSASINAWVMEYFEKIPAEGEHFEVNGIKFYIREVENNRVISLAVEGKPLPESYYEEDDED